MDRKGFKYNLYQHLLGPHLSNLAEEATNPAAANVRGAILLERRVLKTYILAVASALPCTSDALPRSSALRAHKRGSVNTSNGFETSRQPGGAPRTHTSASRGSTSKLLQARGGNSVSSAYARPLCLVHRAPAGKISTTTSVLDFGFAT